MAAQPGQTQTTPTPTPTPTPGLTPTASPATSGTSTLTPSPNVSSGGRGMTTPQQQSSPRPGVSPASAAESVSGSRQVYVFHVDAGQSVAPCVLAGHDTVASLRVFLQQTCHVAVQHQILLDSKGTVLGGSLPISQIAVGSVSDPVFLFDFRAINERSGAEVPVTTCPPPQALPPQPLPDLGAALKQHEASAREHKRSAEQHVHFANTVVGEVHTQLRGLMAARLNVQNHVAKLAAECDKLLQMQDAAAAEDKAIIDAVPIIAQLFEKSLLPAQLDPKRSGHLGVPTSTNTSANTSKSTSPAPSSKGPTPPADTHPSQQQRHLADGSASTSANTSVNISGREDEGDVFEPAPMPGELRPLSDLLTSLSPEELTRVAADCTRRYRQIAEHGLAFRKATDNIQAVLANDLVRHELQFDPRFEHLLSEVNALAAEQMMRCRKIAEQCMACAAQSLPRDSVVAIATQHIHEGQSILTRTNTLQAAVTELASMKQAFSAETLRQLQVVMRLQSMMKIVRREHPVQVYHEAVSKARRSCATLRFALRMPHACSKALTEFARRRTFTSKYTKLAQQAGKMFTDLRRKEISTRQQFHTAHGQFLPNWPVFQTLNDYPHSVVAEPKPFDTHLPDLLVGDVRSAAESVSTALEELGLGDRFLDTWGCCSPGEQINLTDFADNTEESGLGDMFLDNDSEVVSALQDQLLILHCECELLETECDMLRRQVAGHEKEARNSDKAHEQEQREAQAAEASAAREHALLAESKAAAMQTRLSTLEESMVESTVALEKSKEQLQTEKQANLSLQAEIEALRQKLAEAEAAAAEAARQQQAALALDSSLRSSDGAFAEVNTSSGSGGGDAGSAEILPGEKLSLTEFAQGDLALFVPWHGRKRLIALNKSARNVVHVLSEESMTKMGVADKGKSIVVGRISSITPMEAEADNPLKLAAGTKYFEIGAKKAERKAQSAQA